MVPPGRSVYVVAQSGFLVPGYNYGHTRQVKTCFTPWMLIEPKLQRETRLIELVETNNIARSLKRIKAAPNGFERERWKMAIYHAMFLAGCFKSELEKVRQAFELP